MIIMISTTSGTVVPQALESPYLIIVELAPHQRPGTPRNLQKKGRCRNGQSLLF